MGWHFPIQQTWGSSCYFLHCGLQSSPQLGATRPTPRSEKKLHCLAAPAPLGCGLGQAAVLFLALHCQPATRASLLQIRCQDVVSWAPSSDDDCDFLGIAFLAYSAQPAWSRPRRDECSKPARSTSSWQGGPHGNYYSSFAVLKNKLSIISVKTGEEEPRERPAAQKPGAHVSALLVARWSRGPRCFWPPLR